MNINACFDVFGCVFPDCSKSQNDHVCVLYGFGVEFWLGLSSVRLAASQNTRHFIKVQTAFEWSDAHGTVYLDLDLSIAFRSLSMSSFLASRDLLSCRFSSPSSSDLISELTDEVLWPCRPPERAGEHKHSVSEEHLQKHHRLQPRSIPTQTDGLSVIIVLLHPQPSDLSFRSPEHYAQLNFCIKNGAYMNLTAVWRCNHVTFRVISVSENIYICTRFACVWEAESDGGRMNRVIELVPDSWSDWICEEREDKTKAWFGTSLCPHWLCAWVAWSG